MNFSTKLITITLILASATLAQAGTGACTAGACRYCDKTGEDKFCDACIDTAMSGAGINRKCSGGTTVTGCDLYKTTDDTSSGKVYCSSCDTQNSYYLKTDAGDKTKNTCVKCDRTKNHMTAAVECKTATVVAGCALYSSTEDKCASCETGKVLISNKCETAIANCNVHSATVGECTTCATTFHLATDKKSCKANIANCATAKDGSLDTKCTTCVSKYTTKAADETCQAITVANCLSAPADKPAECTGCADGYFLESATACTKITVANCKRSDTSKKAGECDQCESGFFKKEDKTMCTAMESCSSALYKTTLQCV